MQAIGEYTQLVKLILGESAKYFLLLVFVVLAIRLWRRLPRVAGKNKRNNLILACLASMATCGIGYVSMSHSLSLLYSYYGMRAFSSGHLSSAFVLFQESSEFWKSADAVGKQGVCLLLLKQPRQGTRLLDEAKMLRGGKCAPFEQFYEGLMLFFQEEPDKAMPLLDASCVDLAFRWDALKMLAIIQMEKGRTADAARLMEPFLQVEVESCDHAYLMAGLKLQEGKKAEARALLDKFPSGSLPGFWKSRFEKLRAKTQN
jgi:hypothetical protein